MIEVLTPQEMRAADAQAVAAVGVDTLIRYAAGAIAAYVRAHFAPGSRIVAFAGPGNNGGDARVACALLSEYDCVIYGPDDMPHDDAAARAMLADAALAIDGLFGTGARLPLPDAYAPALRALDARERRVLAIDIPSGVDALTGAVPGNAVRATATLTLAAMKPGLLFDPAREYCGELWLADDIGIEHATLAAHARTFAALDDDAFLALLPHRARDTDKRSAGAPLIVAGSAQFPGAAVLCARGAARAGAGYVTIATAPKAIDALHAHLLEQVVVELDDDLLDNAKRSSAVGIGPGLGLDKRTGETIRDFIVRCELPMVIDASGLFHLAKHLDILRGKACVLTPHEGEFARLSGLGTIAPGTRVERLREFTQRTGITTLLKGPATLIDDGACMHINPTGTQALATAGTGDVLTGMIATLLAQGLSPVDAACTAAYWHGATAQQCAIARPVGVVAGDLPDALAATLRSISPSTDALRRVYASANY
jgi:ADP-dependent NAD(P)H-hydrate dehydratase / NAD(P)H-hydrate epimerase